MRRRRRRRRQDRDKGEEGGREKGETEGRDLGREEGEGEERTPRGNVRRPRAARGCHGRRRRRRRLTLDPNVSSFPNLPFLQSQLPPELLARDCEHLLSKVSEGGRVHPPTQRRPARGDPQGGTHPSASTSQRRPSSSRSPRSSGPSRGASGRSASAVETLSRRQSPPPPPLPPPPGRCSRGIVLPSIAVALSPTGQSRTCLHPCRPPSCRPQSDLGKIGRWS